jgi:hypothetical protein
MKIVPFYSTDYWPFTPIKRRLVRVNFLRINELVKARYDFGRSRSGKK